MIEITALCKLMVKPPVFAPGEAHFWTDPHIAGQMLVAHLDPNTDAASRRPDTIQRSTNWIVRTLDLQAGNSLLDLGCGPGLYATRLALHGLQVTGVDISQNSIEYAREYARRHGLEITYRCQDYLELEDESSFDAALLIYGDLCPLSPQQRSRLLSKVKRALKAGGHFVLDVTTPQLRQREGLKNSWYAVQAGFWKSGPHLVLQQGFSYPEDIYLDQYVVVETDGKISVYRNWFQDYTARTIRAELEAGGFIVQSLSSDLVGTPYEETSDWIGIVASKPG
ncbi:MAG TPA: class I SAM-dependent methyltransferase [Anaerolineae bacterium]